MGKLPYIRLSLNSLIICLSVHLIEFSSNEKVDTIDWFICFGFHWP